MWPGVKDLKKYASKTGIVGNGVQDEEATKGLSQGYNKALNSINIDEDEDEVSSLIDELSKESKIKKDLPRKQTDDLEDDDEVSQSFFGACC